MLTHQLEEYIESHSSAESEVLQEIVRRTNRLTVNPHMLSGQVQGRILSMFSHLIQPRYILELGTFTGYSALCLAEGLLPNGELHTIEHNDELEELIVSNLSLSLLHEKIHLHIGDALVLIPELSADKQWDLVFIDADKRQYCAYFDAVLPHVRQGGIILADNTLWDGHIIDAAYLKDKQTIGLRQFNDKIAREEGIEKVILPLRDGLTVIRKL